MQNRKTHEKNMWITTTAMMIAVLIVLQWATGLIPLPTKLAQQLLTGSCVNAVLAVSVLLGGLWCGVTVAVLAPAFAQLLGVGAQFVQLVPAIMIGNAVYVLLLSLLAARKKMLRRSGICAVASAGALCHQSADGWKASFCASDHVFLAAAGDGATWRTAGDFYPAGAEAGAEAFIKKIPQLWCTAQSCGIFASYLRTNSTPKVPGPQWQETVQPASVS